jgi:L-2-hydroxycarboxylate dehydrogenase (NAD+)
MNQNEEKFYIVPEGTHNELVRKAYAHRGFDEEECEAAARFSSYATHHGIRTHNALKALHLDDLVWIESGGVQTGGEDHEERKPIFRFTGLGLPV